MNALRELRDKLSLNKKDFKKLCHAYNEVALRTKYTNSVCCEGTLTGILFSYKARQIRLLAVAENKDLFIMEENGLYSLTDWLANDNTKPVKMPKSC